MAWDFIVTPATATEFTGYWESPNGDKPFILTVTGKPNLIIECIRFNDINYKGVIATLWERVAFSEGYAFNYLANLYGGTSLIKPRYFNDDSNYIPDTEIIVKPKSWMFYESIKVLELD